MARDRRGHRHRSRACRAGSAGPRRRHPAAARRPVPVSPLVAADIIAGDDASMALAIVTADCVPILIGDRRTGAVAAAHAGWRGTALRVAAAVVNAMKTSFGSRPADLVAAIGPSIGPCCYEVGGDVRERFEREGFPRCGSRSLVFQRGAPPGGQSTDGPQAGTRKAGRDILESLGRDARSTGAGGRQARPDLRRRAVHGKPRGNVLLVPPRRIGRGTARRGHPEARFTVRMIVVRSRRPRPPAGAGLRKLSAYERAEPSSIALFASRSACALRARPTCSKLTRPMSCASSRALACSGCRPGCFTL